MAAKSGPMKKAEAPKAPPTKRTLRWLIVSKDAPLQWNQLKSAPHPADTDRDLTVSSDRKIDFVKTEENPAYVKVEDRKPGQRLTPEQRTKSTSSYKHPKALRESLTAAGQALLQVIDKIAHGDVVEARYSLETGEISYIERFNVDGSPVDERHTTNDETVVEAFHEFAQELSEAIATDGKPLTLAEVTDNSDIVSEVREPEE